MKTLFFTYFLLVSLEAQADLKMEVEILNTHHNAAIAALNEIKKEAPNCTDLAAGAITDAVNEAQTKLIAINESLNGAAAAMLINTINENSCTMPSMNEIQSMHSATELVQSGLAEIQEEIQKNDKEILYRLSGSDSKNSSCKNQTPGNKNTSKASLAYQAFKNEIKNYKLTSDRIQLELAGLPNMTKGGSTVLADTSNACSNKNTAALWSQEFVQKAAFSGDRAPAFIQNNGNNWSEQAL